MRGARAYDRIGCQFFGRFTHRSIVGKHKSGFDRRLGFSAAFKQATFDQKAVGTLAWGAHSVLPSV